MSLAENVFLDQNELSEKTHLSLLQKPQFQISQLNYDLIIASIDNVNYEYSQCTYHVSVVVSSNGLTNVTRLNSTTGRFNDSWTALEENVYTFCVISLRIGLMGRLDVAF